VCSEVEVGDNAAFHHVARPGRGPMKPNAQRTHYLLPVWGLISAFKILYADLPMACMGRRNDCVDRADCGCMRRLMSRGAQRPVDVLISTTTHGVRNPRTLVNAKAVRCSRKVSAQHGGDRRVPARSWSRKTRKRPIGYQGFQPVVAAGRRLSQVLRQKPEA